MAYPNLPGLTVTLNDLGLQIAPPPSGPKVTFLGVTSNTDIPLREPYAVSNVGAAVAACWVSGASGGTYPGELALAIEEAAKVGATNIEIVAIAHVSGATLDSYNIPTGAGPGLRYLALDDAYEAIQDSPLNVVVPLNAWANCPSVSGKFTSQLAQFCYQAVTEVDNPAVGVIPVMPILHWAMAYARSSAANTVGLTGNANVGTEVLAITGFNDLVFATPSAALATEWEKHLTLVNTTYALDPASATTNAWSGYLAGSEDTAYGFLNYVTADNAGTAVKSNYWTHFQGTNLAGSLVVDQRGNKADAGSRICVTAIPATVTLVSTPKLAAALGEAASSTIQNTDGAASYAALINTLLPHSATTNKPIASLSAQRKISASQANRMAGRRITTMLNRSPGFVVSNGITGGHNVSKYIRTDYANLTTVRVVDAAISAIRNIGERFIGEPNTATARNAMSAEIDKALRAMKAARAVNGYRFFITATPDQQVLGEATVDLTLIPAFELKQINVNVSLTKE